MLRMDGVVKGGGSFQFQDSCGFQARGGVLWTLPLRATGWRRPRRRPESFLRRVRAPGLHLASNLKLSPNLLTSIATLGGVAGEFLRVERK